MQAISIIEISMLNDKLEASNKNIEVCVLLTLVFFVTDKIISSYYNFIDKKEELLSQSSIHQHS